MTSTKSTKYKFEGKVALVTGSSSGIGASIAYQLACYGASVVIHGRDFKTLAEVGQKIKQDTDIIPFEILGDMLNENTPTKLITQTIAKFGQLDFLVNNAGGSTPNEELENNPELLEAFDNVMRLNLRSVLEMIQLAVPYLKKTKGNIVNISSIDAIRPCGLIYSTSKAALDMVTKISAQQLGPLGIRVNSVNPGEVVTAMGRSLGIPNIFELNDTFYRQLSPLGRVSKPSEIANLVSFLVSDDANNITGAIYVTDSGALVMANS